MPVRGHLVAIWAWKKKLRARNCWQGSGAGGRELGAANWGQELGTGKYRELSREPGTGNGNRELGPENWRGNLRQRTGDLGQGTGDRELEQELSTTDRELGPGDLRSGLRGCSRGV